MTRDIPAITVLSRADASRFHSRQPYVVISIRSPGDSIVKLRADANRKARINVDFCDTTPEWEKRALNPLEPMSVRDARRIAAFVADHWQKADIIIHCHQGISRSAGVAAGILEAFSADPSKFDGWPYDPNPYVRKMMRDALYLHIQKC